MDKNKANVPKIRFPGFTDPWEQRKVSEITLFHKQGFYTTEQYNENKKYYLLRGTDLTENKLLLKDTPKVNATEKEYKDFKAQLGDFLIVRSGTVGTYGIVDIDIPAIFGSYLIDFRFDKSVVTNEFFGYFYQSDLFKDQLRQIIQQSANTNINAENIKSTKINLPSITEQKKIGTFFCNLDNLITLYQRKLNHLQDKKKSLLQKMFPKNGEDFPELRFPGFTDPWEQRKLGDVVPITMGQSPDGSTYSDTPSDYILIQGNADLKNGWVIPRVWTSQVTKKADAGDLIMSVRAPAGEMGKTAYNAVIGRGVAAIKGNEFIFQSLVKMNGEGYWRKLSCGSTFESLNSDNIKNAKIMIPNLDEQAQVGAFFKNLDNLITLHQRKLNHLQEQKKALLQQMFV